MINYDEFYSLGQGTAKQKFQCGDQETSLRTKRRNINQQYKPSQVCDLLSCA